MVSAKDPDLVLLDLQIGSMGGIATCLAIRQEEGALRLRERAVALLLDRHADVFLAGEARADGWMIKPIDSLRLRRMAKQLLAGDSYFEGLPRSTDDESIDDEPAEDSTTDDSGAGGEAAPDDTDTPTDAGAEAAVADA